MTRRDFFRNFSFSFAFISLHWHTKCYYCPSIKRCYLCWCLLRLILLFAKITHTRAHNGSNLFVCGDNLRDFFLWFCDYWGFFWWFFSYFLLLNTEKIQIFNFQGFYEFLEQSWKWNTAVHSKNYFIFI